MENPPQKSIDVDEKALMAEVLEEYVRSGEDYETVCAFSFSNALDCAGDWY